MDDENEAFYKIIDCLKKIERRYKVLNLDFQKVLDVEEYSKKFLVGILAVKNKVYEKEKEEYTKKFEENVKNYLKIKEMLNEFKKIDNIYNVEINNINFGKTSMRYKEIFNRNLKESINSKSKIISKLRKGRTLSNLVKKAKGKTIVKVSYNTKKSSNNVLNYDDIKDDIKAIKKEIFSKEFEFITVLCFRDYSDKKALINNLKKLNSSVVLVSDKELKSSYNGCVLIPNKNYLNFIFEGFEYLYINDEDSQKVGSNCNYIDYNIIKDMNSKEIKELLIKEYINLFLNLDNNNVIKVLCSTFLNFSGENYYSGGAERYLLDLYEVCKSLGYKMRIYQDSDFEFTRFYRGIEVVGLSYNKQDFKYNLRNNIIDRFNKMALETSMLNIYSSFMEANTKPVSPSVGISHGVAWDSANNKYRPSEKNSCIDYSIIESAKNMDKMVSVDTNTANWFQTIDYKLGNTTEYIPNYVDINEFAPSKENKDTDKIVVTYPRRLYKPRGMYMLLDISDKLIKDFPNIEIHFVGKGFDEDVKHIKEKMKKYPNHIKLYNMPPERMHEVYKNSDISLICTLYSEGTSLSCLEAMASGNAVIATRVGGLTDLIFNNYNGKLIEPNKDSLYDAIASCIKDRDLMEKCKRNGIEVAKEFNKDIWNKRWSSIIKDMAKTCKLKNIEYSKVKIYVNSNNLKSEALNKFIYDLVLEGNIVYIVTNEIDMKKESFGKLQYISCDSELYFEFDKIYKDASYAGEIKEKDVEKIDI